MVLLLVLITVNFQSFLIDSGISKYVSGTETNLGSDFQSFLIDSITTQ